MSDRSAIRAQFIRSAGWGDAAVEPLPGDASFRRYFRLATPSGRRAMLMDAPPPREDVRPFQRVAGLLGGLGYSAPMILAADPAAGFLVLEDLGDATFTRLLATGADEMALYGLGLDLLVDLHDRFQIASTHGLPAYDEPRLLAEVALFTDWFLPAATGSPLEPEYAQDWLDCWRQVLPLARTVPDSLVLRDYHVDNLMRLPGRTGLAACGLLDFQDAVIGPLAYDLVSLIEDARRDVSPAVAQAMRARYLEARPAIDAQALDLAMAVLGAQRHAKVIGIFCRLDRRDGKPQYLAHLPRLWRLIDRALGHPALAPVATWLDRHVPPDLRGIPPRAPR